MVRPVVAGVLGVAAIGVAALVFRGLEPRAAMPNPGSPHIAAPAATSPARAPTEAAAGPTPTGTSTRLAPIFDVVRVSPHGDAVVAGRATPGAEVLVQDGERELGRARADRRGEWVVLSTTPLQPGGRELTVSSREASGAEARSGAPVLLVVPERGGAAAAGATPLAVLIPPADAPRILQAPAPVPATGPVPGPAPAVAVQTPASQPAPRAVRAISLRIGPARIPACYAGAAGHGGGGPAKRPAGSGHRRLCRWRRHPLRRQRPPGRAGPRVCR